MCNTIPTFTYIFMPKIDIVILHGEKSPFLFGDNVQEITK